MQLSTVVLGLALLAVVVVKYGDARATLTSDELLDEMTERLLVRYLESRNFGQDVPTFKSQGRYDNNLARRWWNGPSSSTSNNQWENNSGDFGNQVNTGGGDFGIGNNGAGK